MRCVALAPACHQHVSCPGRPRYLGLGAMGHHQVQPLDRRRVTLVVGRVAVVGLLWAAPSPFGEQSLGGLQAGIVATAQGHAGHLLVVPAAAHPRVSASENVSVWVGSWGQSAGENFG